MILSIGYQCHAADEIRLLAERIGATVIDVRGKPVSRKRGFGGRQLEALLGGRYEWRGGQGLGNYGENVVTRSGVQWLVDQNASGRTILLMCQEDAPGDCHRHTLIARSLLARGVETFHIFDGDVIKASDLQAAIDSPDEESEPASVTLDGFLAGLSKAE